MNFQVKIKNHATTSLKVNDHEICKERPLFTGNIISVNDSVKFKWEYKTCDTVVDSEFASWSDPGKKVLIAITVPFLF